MKNFPREAYPYRLPGYCNGRDLDRSFCVVEKLLFGMKHKSRRQINKVFCQRHKKKQRLIYRKMKKSATQNQKETKPVEEAVASMPSMRVKLKKVQTTPHLSMPR